MVDAAQFTGGLSAVSITQSRTTWGLQIGSHQLRITRTTEARAFSPSGGPRRGLRTASSHVWPLAIGTFASVSAFGLLVFGAIASVPSLPHQGYALSVLVPPPARPDRRKLHHRKPHTTASSSPRRFDEPIMSGTHFDAADEPYVRKAMGSGDLQEWSGPSGERRFLSVGPERIDGKGRCRDLVLLVRDKDGESQTHDGWRCMASSMSQTVDKTALDRLDPLAPPSFSAKQNADLVPSLPHTGDSTSISSQVERH